MVVVDGGDVRLGRYMDDRFGLVVHLWSFPFVNVSVMLFPSTIVYNVRVINPEL